MAVGKWKIPLFLAIASLLCISGIVYPIIKWAQASVSYARLENALQSSDWEARSYGPDVTDYEKVEMAFREVTARSEEIFSISLAEAELGRLPTHYWFIDGRLDGEIPPFSANAFFAHVESCKMNSNSQTIQ
ncbi:hypothetical protein IQ273_16995 [Nodosilinea sp. LEGE 07298]|uniref:hypothetical protein n=1 Tax=Nodosilinea sp. LEGE 07298 TaxID=2777970 RepID=UPI00187E86E2|nr:hypothetical protein [Nodosilinea sp. LEGE 07298]MBE9111106.1 hypothetical protein [Nodosilinea sp. LEGE 07298]